ncbi:hypothetical protein AAG906_025990 [Vitis piasezkii]
MSEVLGFRHSHEAWHALEVSFSHRSKTRELQLKDELQLMHRGSQSIAEFSRTFKGLCDQLAAIGRPIDDTDKIFSTTMMSQLPLPSFAEIVPKALSHEIFERSGHLAKRCWNFLKLKKKQSANLAEAFSACSIQDFNDSEWFPDSGATQNGIAERKHRHVTETGLTLMFHARVPLSLWVEAFSAVFLINRLQENGIFKPRLYHAMHISSSSQLFQALLALKEPRGFKSAAKHPEWLSAMDDEIHALKKNDTWVLVPRPQHHNVVGRWIFKTKLHSDGSIERHKARLVAQGFSQVHGLDFGDTFSPWCVPF